MKFGTKAKVSIGVLVTFVLLCVSPVYASSTREQAEKERIDLFLASQQMLKEQQAPARRKAALFVTNYGKGVEFNLGVRAEANVDRGSQVWLFAEGVYLKEENEVDGFVGLKLLPLRNLPRPLYIGLGIGLKEESRFQLVGGLELTDSFFVEMKYVNKEVSFSAEDVYVVVGFQLPY